MTTQPTTRKIEGVTIPAQAMIAGVASGVWTDRRLRCVAVAGGGGKDWAAYGAWLTYNSTPFAADPPYSDAEIARTGTKLRREAAERLFPAWATSGLTWRD